MTYNVYNIYFVSKSYGRGEEGRGRKRGTIVARRGRGLIYL